MSFDPENVRRYWPNCEVMDAIEEGDPLSFVTSEDYDQLLELYRAAVRENTLDTAKPII